MAHTSGRLVFQNFFVVLPGKHWIQRTRVALNKDLRCRLLCMNVLEVWEGFVAGLSRVCGMTDLSVQALCCGRAPKGLLQTYF